MSTTTTIQRKKHNSDNKLPEKLEVRIEDSVYDVTHFVKKHPGGNVILYSNSFKDPDGVNDVTEAFKEFHGRSTITNSYLNALPKRPADSPREPIMVAFEKWRSQLEKEGYFEPSMPHVIFRLVELVVIYLFGLVCFYYGGWSGNIAGVIVHGMFGVRCGWVQHEGGHNSFTGNMKVDKFIQGLTIGFGLGSSGKKWNHMHDKHHATPQKVGYDIDLDTTPLVAFFKTAVEDNRQRGFYPLWLRFQHLTFLPITSGVFVMLFWILNLHPMYAFKTKKYDQLFWMFTFHTFRPLTIVWVSGLSFLQAYGLVWASAWFSGVYLFGHFSTSHTHCPVVQEEAKNWLEFALEHTVDIEPSNPVVSWVMGYLNCQVLHHLFPHMPQYRQPEVSKKLAEFCKQHGLKYEIIGYFEAWRRTFANLRDVGAHYYENGLDKTRLETKKSDIGATIKSGKLNKEFGG
eukprot:c37106_g1_i1.p1 GENE.c37106_g1_i1~~c37106_g1_i1.p1  ORF type:complete len:487 (-),score=153.16 c37106_g1_i1:71-1441(-)